MNKTKNIILDEVMEGTNWKEKIIISIFQKTFIKIYRKGMARCYNYFNK